MGGATVWVVVAVVVTVVDRVVDVVGGVVLVVDGVVVVVRGVVTVDGGGGTGVTGRLVWVMVSVTCPFVVVVGDVDVVLVVSPVVLESPEASLTMAYTTSARMTAPTMPIATRAAGLRNHGVGGGGGSLP